MSAMIKKPVESFQKAGKSSLDSVGDSANGFIQVNESKANSSDYKIEFKWRNIILLSYFHIAAIYGFLLQKKGSSLIIGWIIGIISALGTTVGAHRLHTHRTFKANLKMRIMLVIMQTMAGQNDMIEWVRDHRVHHKFTDTDADPHNASRGFFFSHMGWLCCKKHPDVKKYGAKIDMSDLENDTILQFQKKYFIPMSIFLNLIMPVLLVCYFGESLNVAWHANIFRYLVGLHLVWCINSVCHIWGYRPFDNNITPTDSYFMGFFGFGEGWHNYHHVFPWDYKTSELPAYWCNFSTAFIDLFAWLGWATELKTVPIDIIEKRILRTGDGTHRYSKAHKIFDDRFDNNNHQSNAIDSTAIWGWGDCEMTEDDAKSVKILNKQFG